jgi:hypothetical protein
MGQCETGHLPQKWPEVRAEKEKADDEKDVVKTLGQDMREADGDVIGKTGPSGATVGAGEWNRRCRFARRQESREEGRPFACARGAENRLAERCGCAKGHISGLG